MARTQAADYEQRREAIVEKAAELFARASFRGTAITDLAAACNTSKSLIYHYYPSKEDILFAVMASHIDQLGQDVAEVMTREETAAVRFRALIRNFMRHYIGAANRQKVLLNELDNLPPERREIILKQQRGIVAAVQHLLAALDPRLAADPVVARVETMLVFGMINWTHTWFDPAGPISAEAVADMVVDRVLGRADSGLTGQHVQPCHLMGQT